MASTANPPRATGADSEDEVKRVNVIFSKDQYNTLKQLADQQGISISDALRQAIKVAKLVVEANRNPEERVLIQKGKEVQEVKIL